MKLWHRFMCFMGRHQPRREDDPALRWLFTCRHCLQLLFGAGSVR